MKTSLILLTIVFAGFAASECRANLNGSDKFNGSNKNTINWGPDFIKGVGNLVQTNGRVAYISAGTPTASDLAGWPWILNFGSHTQDWEVRIDTSVPILSLTNYQDAVFGLLIFPGTNTSVINNNRMVVALEQYQNVGGQQHLFYTTVTAGGSSLETYSNTTTTYGSVQVAFDAATKTLSAYYDADGPTCGYSWTLLTTTNLDAAWNMTDTNVYSIMIFGQTGNGVAIALTNNLYGANFSASSGVLPNLGIQLSSAAAVLSWPTNAPTCILESAYTLTPPVCWQILTNTPTVVGTNFTVTNKIMSADEFYQLSR